MSVPDYSGIYDAVRSKLQKQPDELGNDDADMVMHTKVIVPTLLRGAPRLNGSYANLSEGDKTLFDWAAGCRVAARMRPAILAAENDGRGVVVEKEIGDARYRYAAYNGTASGSKETVEEKWEREAEESFGAMEILKAKPGARPSFVGTPGRRRADQKQTGYRPLDPADVLRPTGGRKRR